MSASSAHGSSLRTWLALFAVDEAERPDEYQLNHDIMSRSNEFLPGGGNGPQKEVARDPAEVFRELRQGRMTLGDCRRADRSARELWGSLSEAERATLVAEFDARALMVIGAFERLRLHALKLHLRCVLERERQSFEGYTGVSEEFLNTLDGMIEKVAVSRFGE